MPVISVVVPVYNAEKFLKNCVDSLLNQTFQDFELILIDDGSKDSSYSLMQFLRQRDEKIKIFRHANHGAGYTRNKGIEIAAGKYITFVDSDDFVDSNYLETLLNQIGNAQVLISGFKKVTMEEHKVLYNSVPKDCLWTEFKYVSTCAKLYELEFLKSNNLKYASMKIGEDVYFNLSINSVAERVKIVPYAGYNYCLNDNSVTQNKKTLKNDNNILFLLKSIHNNINLHHKYSSNMISYFYLKTVVQYLLMQVSVCDKNIFLNIYKESFDFLGANHFMGTIYLKDEEFKVKMCVLFFMLFHRLNMMGILYNFLNKAKLQVG